MNKKQFYIERITAHPDSVYIFTEMKLEPYGRIGLGIFELIAVGLLLYPKTSHIGGVIGLGLMLGAIFSHLFVLGVEIHNDGGTLFILAILVFVCSLVVVLLKKDKLRALIKRK